MKGDKRKPAVPLNPEWPANYKVQKNIRCCANCAFGGYIGDPLDGEGFCVCEVNGECSNSDYGAIAKNPLGDCDAFKWPQEVKSE